MADDLRDFGGAYTRDVVRTPNLDRLAARGTRFDRAYVQYPVCNPSRVSMLTGLRCEETGVVGNAAFFRTQLPDVITLPQMLRGAGWTAHSYGKILHAASTGEAVREDWLDAGKSWDRAEQEKASSPHRRGEFRNLTGGKLPWCDVGIIDGPDDDQPDARTAASAVAAMEELTGKGTPWLVAAGFHRPHDPFHAPRKFFEMYPKESLKLWTDAPQQGAEAKLAVPGGWRADFAKFTDDERRSFLQAYLAGVSYMDSQVGRLLDTLDRLGLWEKTVVIFVGDHGYHLGERGWWNKSTLFERSCRAPMIVAAPGAKAGQVCRTPVEFVDVFPTVADFCRVKPPHTLVGTSLRPLLADPTGTEREVAFTLVTRGEKNFGRSMRTSRWRFTRWSDGAVELYDHDADPEETRDVSKEEKFAETVKALDARLGALPPWPRPGS